MDVWYKMPAGLGLLLWQDPISAPAGALRQRCGSAVVFVCESNLYMEYTPIKDDVVKTRPGSVWPAKIVIDGNDADEVYRTAQEAYAKARAGEGPSLIDA